MLRKAAIILLLASAEAFTTKPQAGRISTHLHDSTKSPPFIPPPKDISYGEESRSFRRTVYTHDDWVKHRSPDRFIRNIVSTTSSGIYKNIGREVTATTGVATFVVLWNMLTAGYTDFNGVFHDAALLALPALSLPLTPFTLSSPSLGLLLGKEKEERSVE